MAVGFDTTPADFIRSACSGVVRNTKYHDFNLGIWVSERRVAYKKGTLSAERIKLLEEAGFVWRVRGK